MTSTIGFKGCPFCGCEVNVSYGEPGRTVTGAKKAGVVGTLITCAKCSVRMFVVGSIDEAIEVWNRRVYADRPVGEWLGVDEKDDAWDCSECVAMVGRRMLYCPRCGARMKNGIPRENDNPSGAGSPG